MDWNTRLQVQVGSTPICPIDSFQPTITTPATPIHSVEADNVGVSFGPRTATFTMALPAIGTAVAELTRMALDRTRFEITVAEADGDDWSFAKLLFRDCIITSANPSNVMIQGAPAATFNGIILAFGEDADIET
ncbi:hypothetical protein [Marinibacterium sp. SX1]|uniref:hypothetical protein n=1 Tax=Marinibacterium sp. SX1 TaxID=3388424 RepID=UPI003D17F3D9